MADQLVNASELRSGACRDDDGEPAVGGGEEFLTDDAEILVIAYGSVARSAKRAREISLRKVIGSSRRLLMAQFLAESSLLTFFSLVLGIALPFLDGPLDVILRGVLGNVQNLVVRQFAVLTQQLLFRIVKQIDELLLLRRVLWLVMV